MTISGFEYKKKKAETPFETFLRYTDEKQKSAEKLTTILDPLIKPAAKLLDIGTGNGEYLSLALSGIEHSEDLNLTLVEPSEDLVAQLKMRFAQQLKDHTTTIVVGDSENFVSNELFDVILMSHLFYHIPRVKWSEEIKKALSLLSPDGMLIIVLRQKDDTYEFKMAFKPLLFDTSFKALTIDDVLERLPEDSTVKVDVYDADSELVIPYHDNEEDTISIIEFFLNKEWVDIPQAIRDEAMQFIDKRQGVFDQRDGIAVIRKS